MSRVILIGSGATRGTLGEIAPVAKDFGKHLNKKVSDWREKYPYLAAVVRFLEPQIPDTTEKPWALDKVWSAIDNRVKLRYILGLSLPGAPFPPPTTKEIYSRDLDPWGLAGFELRCAVAKVYGADLDQRIKDAAEGNGTLKKELALLQPGDCVISFNYDLLAEEIMKNLNKNVIRANQWLDPTCASDAILLCKPHGCLSWKQQVPEKGKIVEILNRPIRPMKEDEIDFDPDKNVTIQPGIAGPVPFKSEIIVPELQLQGDVRYFFYLLVAQWKCAIQRISKTEKLVIMGYGFPPEDLHAHYLFAEAAAKRKNKKLEVEVFEKCERHFEEVRKEIYELFKRVPCKDRGPIEP